MNSPPVHSVPCYAFDQKNPMHVALALRTVLALGGPED
jgi:hypothetical protein